MPNLYRRPNSPYWWMWCFDASGQRQQKSTKCERRTDADKRAREIERRFLLGPGQATPYALLDALEELKKHKVRGGRAAATLEKTREKGRQLIKHFGADRDVNQLTLADCELYVERRLAEKISRHCIAMELGTLRAALRVASKHHLYKGDPRHLWPSELDDAYKPRKRWLPPDEYRKLGMGLTLHRREYVAVYCYTGVRYSELYRIHAKHVSLRERVVFVDGTKTDEAPRELPIADELVGLFASLLARHKSGPLFPKVWQKGRMNADLKAACERVGIERVSCNDFRRTFASWMRNAGVDEGVVAKLLGHKNSKMVRSVYGQLSRETKAAAIAALPRVAIV